MAKTTSGQRRLKNLVQKEIEDHEFWCRDLHCQTFRPELYRAARIISGMSREAVQKDYYLCHSFR